MKIVIDSNRVIAAFVKESTTRDILFKENFDFVAPDFIQTELHKYQGDIIKKAKLTEKEFSILLSLFFENIEIIPQFGYEEFSHEFKNEIKDPKDIPYLAAAMATHAEGIWSHDLHFIEQKKVKIFTNIDMLNMITG